VPGQEQQDAVLTRAFADVADRRIGEKVGGGLSEARSDAFACGPATGAATMVP
jgi:hypothetical protein